MPSFEVVQQGSFFRALVRTLSPPYLAGDTGYRWTYSAIGIPLDMMGEYLRLGVLQGFPDYARSDALRFIGTDRKMLRGFREDDLAYAPRLRTARQTWKLAGNAPTLLRELAAYFSPSPPVIRYVVNGYTDSGAGLAQFADWWTYANGTLSYHRQSPSNWDWDGTTDQIRFWIIIYRNEGFTPWFWGDGHAWGGGQSWGYEEEFTENFASDARKFISQWKAAGSHCWHFGGIIVTGDASLFDPTGSGAGFPDGTWGNYFNRVGVPKARGLPGTVFYLDGI
jgi:hypothetical protein